MRKTNWHTKRKEPYTEIGIKRLGCIRCGKQAVYQWQICSDGNNYRPICEQCAILLNDAVLKFMRHPNHEQHNAEYTSLVLDS